MPTHQPKITDAPAEPHANAEMPAHAAQLSRKSPRPPANAPAADQANAPATTANAAQAAPALERLPNHAAQEPHAPAARTEPADAATTVLATRASALDAPTDETLSKAIHNILNCLTSLNTIISSSHYLHSNSNLIVTVAC